MKCPVFNRCGGCKYQNIPYEEQIETKKKELVYATRFQDIKVFSGPEFGYRNRMDFVFHKEGLGLRQSWDRIVDVKECLISNDKINALLKEVRDLKTDPFDFNTRTGTFKYALIRATKSSAISFVINSDSEGFDKAIEMIKKFSKDTSADNIIITKVKAKSDVSVSSDFEVVKGCDMLEEDVMGNKFIFSVQGFFQNNSVMNTKMHEYVHAILKEYDTKGHDLLDLYAGVGTFGINNSKLFRHVRIVESVKECIDAANINIKENSADAEAMVLDAKEISKLDLKEGQYIITDPPRSGMHPKTVHAINRLRPKLIIYVSCNIRQLAKDIRALGYKVKSAALFDLFPQTPHSEAVIELILDCKDQ